MFIVKLDAINPLHIAANKADKLHVNVRGAVVILVRRRIKS